MYINGLCDTSIAMLCCLHVYARPVFAEERWCEAAVETTRPMMVLMSPTK